jgi:hypothetical protein
MSEQKLGGNIGLPRVVPGMIRVPDGGNAGGSPEAPDADEEISGEEQQKIIERGKKNFELAESAEAHNRDEGRSDDQFYLGKQWSSTDEQARATDKRPCLTFNKLPTFCRQVTNDYRMNRMSITVLPMDDGADEQAAKYQAAWIRAVERRARADLAYDWGFESAVRKGYGYWRILLEYEDEQSFKQIPVARRILNHEAVYMDPAIEQFDASDARWAFIAQMMPREAFKQEYPDADQMEWPLASTTTPYGSWADKLALRVAEYFEITREKQRLVKLENGHIGFWEDLSAAGKKIDIVEERETWRKTMTWYKMTGVQILEWTTWPITMVPIVRTVGDEVNVEGKTYVFGIVRQAKDPQRAYNYWRSKEAESIALVPNSPYIVAEGQMDGYEQDWKTAHQKPIPALIYRPVTDENGNLIPPPHREPPPAVPAAFVQAAQGAEQDMVTTTGVRFPQVGGPQDHVYDESGRALREMRRSGDIGTFHYVDNFAQALRRTGEIYLALMKAIMIEPRWETVTHEDEKDELVKFDPNAPKPIQQEKHPVTGRTVNVVNPLKGRYGTTVAIGPDYATKRIEAAESMMDFGRAIGPDKLSLIADIVAENQDWPGHEKIAKRFAAALPPGLVQPDMKDVPPAVQAVLQQLQQKVQQDAQQIQAMQQQLMSKQQQYAIEADNNEKQFEAKILGIMQKQLAAELASHDAHIGSQMKDLADAVREFHKIMTAPTGATNGAANV